VRPPRVKFTALPGPRPWVASIGLGIACLGAGLWGYYAEDPSNQNPMFAIAYFWLPLVALMFVVASRGSRSGAILGAVAILDIEAGLLGAGPLIALPFAVAVPLVGVAVAARFVPGRWRLVPYVAAWAASSMAVTIAVIRILDLVEPSAIVVIPAFMFVDAVALASLWRLDANRLSALFVSADAESKFRDLLDGVDLVGVHVDRDSRIDFINEFALKVTGWTREEILGRDWWDTFATPERRDAARARWNDTVAARSDMDHQRESTILTKSGDVRLIRWSHVTRHDAEGRVTGVASLGEDITAIRAIEDAAAQRRRDAFQARHQLAAADRRPWPGSEGPALESGRRGVARLDEEEVIGRPMPPVFMGRDRWAIARRFVRATQGQPVDHELLGADPPGRRGGLRPAVRRRHCATGTANRCPWGSRRSMSRRPSPSKSSCARLRRWRRSAARRRRCPRLQQQPDRDRRVRGPDRERHEGDRHARGRRNDRRGLQAGGRPDSRAAGLLAAGRCYSLR
jgi:PAS domain S-box-containing protein